MKDTCPASRTKNKSHRKASVVHTKRILRDSSRILDEVDLDIALSLDTRKRRIDNKPSSRSSLCQAAHCAGLTNPREVVSMSGIRCYLFLVIMTLTCVCGVFA